MRVCVYSISKLPLPWCKLHVYACVSIVVYHLIKDIPSTGSGMCYESNIGKLFIAILLFG